MTRITLVAFVLLTGFFYVTGKPVDETGPVTNTFADLASQKTVIGQAPKSNGISNLFASRDAQAGRNRDVRAVKPVQISQNTKAATPDIPARNPRRGITSSPEKTKTIPKVRPTTSSAVQTARLGNRETNQIFGEARANFTGGAIKPLVVSYQQRYRKARQPVLGPRLTAVLVKRELRRIGCYRGNVTSNWDNSAKAALQLYNTNAGTNLSTQTPTVGSLEKLQLVTKTVCFEKPVTKPTIVAHILPTRSKTVALRKNNQWRTKIQRRKTNYRPLPTSNSPRYNRGVKRRVVDTHDARPITRSKPHTIAKKRRIKHTKRTRVAKRKARRRTAVRSWRRTYRRKRFGFSNRGGSFSLNN